MSPARGDREKPPPKRDTWRYELELLPDGDIPNSTKQKVYVDLATYPDGRLAEVFLRSSKDGSPLETYLAAVARQTSKLLQYGAPVASALSSACGVGLTGGRIDAGVEELDGKVASSVLDAVAQLVAAEVDEDGFVKEARR